MEWAVSVQTGPDAVVLACRAPEVRVDTNGGVRLALGGVSAWTEPGQPRLPVFAFVLEVNDNVMWSIDVEPGAFHDQAIGWLHPMPSLVSVSESDEVSRMTEIEQPDPAVYELDTFWPGQWHGVDEAKGGGRRFLRVALHPWHYQPRQQTLRTYSNLMVTVRFRAGEATGP